MTVFSAILPNFAGHVIISRRFRLQLGRTIGRGAYGVVYLAHDLSSPSDNPSYYAVKCMLRHELHSELEHVQAREITYHRHMSSHPHITTLHEVITDEHYVYVVMDFCDGGDLFGAITDRHSFFHKDDNIKSAVLQLLDAVEACHSAGIYHRDLKPENILCAHGDSDFFLSDFGLATQSSASTSFGCGSSYYMSPGMSLPPFRSMSHTHAKNPSECLGELCSHHKSYCTSVSDVWSIGIVLANMITGRNPWRIASLCDDSYNLYLHDRSHFLLSVFPVSREAGHLLTRILDPNPHTRITIPELRLAVLDVPTFFPSNDMCVESFEAGTYCEGSVTEVSFEIEVEMRSKLADSSVPPECIEVTASSFVNQGSLAGSSSSGTESTGPVTPDTHAVEPITIVSLLVLAEQCGVADALVVPPPAVAKAHIKIPKQVQRFMGAIHRIF